MRHFRSTDTIGQNRLEALAPISGRHLEEARQRMAYISGLRRCDTGGCQEGHAAVVVTVRHTPVGW
jgi:hypothetical protein